ncbi:alpha/beta hydrolase family protein [Nodularia spumigena]|uniref:alpha/beta hydrolase family protein n=1 Tax=Nodularia spumigena TaxID=70799 RepID=UPI002B1EA574|nr:alpha/beta hydrolase [Nodularia spumigena]MEA5558005.1 alpha/beta hydrolase [Nodularia spumigena CH309]
MAYSDDRPPEQTIEFVGSQGHALAGRLHLPPERAKGAILLAHCFSCSKDLHTMTRLSKGLVDAGYAALRFDFTGLGDSGGDFAETSVSANVTDLTRAAVTLIEMGFGPCGLIGHSLGGAAAVLAAHRLKTVRSLVTIGAPADVEHVTHLFADRVDDLRSRGRATVSIGGRAFDLDAGFLDDLDRHDVLAEAADLGRPYCVIHARDDDIVGFDNAVRLHAAARDPKQLVALETGGHLFAARAAADEVVEAVVDWFDRTL